MPRDDKEVCNQHEGKVKLLTGLNDVEAETIICMSVREADHVALSSQLARQWRL